MEIPLGAADKWACLDVMLTAYDPNVEEQKKIIILIPVIISTSIKQVKSYKFSSGVTTQNHSHLGNAILIRS